MKKAIDKGLVKIDGRVAGTGNYILGGETIELFENEIETRPSLEMQLEVLFEDEHLAIVNKPSGIEVSGNKKWTIENALPAALTMSSELNALKHPQAIHRLDYPTSGVLLIGKTSSAVAALNKMFEERQVEKVYHAIVIGQINQEGIIDFPIDEKPSVSNYTLLSSIASNKYGGLNLLEMKPETGRRHQLRKHLYQKGNPILGDREYGIEGRVMSGSGLFLHATSLQFNHPITQEVIKVESALPKKFRKLFPQA